MFIHVLVFEKKRFSSIATSLLQFSCRNHPIMEKMMLKHLNVAKLTLILFLWSVNADVLHNNLCKVFPQFL